MRLPRRRLESAIDNVALAFGFVAARDALFGPILVAQTGELARQVVEAARVKKWTPTRGYEASTRSITT